MADDHTIQGDQEELRIKNLIQAYKRGEEYLTEWLVCQMIARSELSRDQISELRDGLFALNVEKFK